MAQKSPLFLDDLPFAVESEAELCSHRSPEALWQSDFDQLTGCIYHLGNPGMRGRAPGGFFFAYELLSQGSRNNESGMLEFASAYREGIERLLEVLLVASPKKETGVHV